MGFFKTKEEKEIIAKMERDDQTQKFNELITELKNKRAELAKIAAEAELNGDDVGYQTAVNSLLDVNDGVSMITQTKTNFDIINLTNSIGVCMASAMNVLDNMASSKSQMPNMRKIRNAQLKLNKYMRNVRIGQEALKKSMAQSNPANRHRSKEEIDSVRPLIDAEREKLYSKTNPIAYDLAQEIQNEKNKII